MEKDKRQYERIRTSYYLRVYDDASDEYMGHVYDISQSGMRLISEHQFDAGRVFEIKIRMPEEGIMEDAIVLKAECRWSKSNEAAGLIESGFQFKTSGGMAIFSIKTLINDILDKPVE